MHIEINNNVYYVFIGSRDKTGSLERLERFKIQDSRTLFNHGKNSSGYILQTIAQTKLQIQKNIYI